MIIFYGVVIILMVLLLLSELENRKADKKLESKEHLVETLQKVINDLEKDAEYERNARARRKKASQPLVKQRKKK